MNSNEEALSYEEALQFIKDELLTEEQQVIPHLAECILEATMKGEEYLSKMDHKFTEPVDTSQDINLKENLPYYEKIKDNKPRDEFNSQLEQIQDDDVDVKGILKAFKEF